MTSTNRSIFEAHLTEAYRDLFQNDSDYSYAASRNTPEELANKMVQGLAIGSANHNGNGVKRACTAIGIKPTRKEIMQFLNQ